MTSDEELLERTRAGDEAAFVTLYRRRQGGIYRYALHMSGSAAVAEDITQEVFLALMTDWARWDAKRGTVSSYLYGIARKQVLRSLERRSREAELVEEVAASDDTAARLARRESIAAVRSAVLALPAHYREAVVLCELEEMDYAEAAEALACPVGTVRSRLHRARELLAEKLAGAREPARCGV
jgi:RNA polymerase sigma-70 factor (ECF subfamily)